MAAIALSGRILTPTATTRKAGRQIWLVQIINRYTEGRKAELLSAKIATFPRRGLIALLDKRILAPLSLARPDGRQAGAEPQAPK